ncbi:hypothetical protein DITRI_Ditri09bG0038200 [Diplodiscus trichospermus]
MTWNSRAENGQLGVGLRRAMRPQGNVPFTSSNPITFSQVLSNALRAYATRTLFTIYYKPRFNGTIVGIEDADPIRWRDSKWRSLKVNWDQHETSTTAPPEKVSPWEIQPAPAPPALNPLPMP